MCLNLQASCLAGRVELERARDVHERAIGIQQELVAAFPANKEYRNGLFGLQNNIGIAEFEMGNYLKAGDWFQKTGETAEALFKIDPNDRERRYRVAFAKCNLARALLPQWRLDEAERLLREAIQVYGKLTGEFRNLPDCRFRKAQAEKILARLIWQRGDGAAEADRLFQSVVEAFESLIRDGYASNLVARELEWTYGRRGELARHEASDVRGLRQALVWFDKSVDGLESVYRNDPAVLMIRRQLSEAHRDRAITYELIGDYDKALADWGRALEVSVPRLKAEYQAGRIAVRLRQKAITIDQGLAELDKLPDPHRQHPAAFDKARFCLIAASLDPANRKDFEDRAMQALGVAFESGNTHLLSLVRDREFATLRARRDFQELLGRIGIRPATKESPKGGTELP